MSDESLISECEDLSTRAGFQFKFYCEHCGAPEVSSFQPRGPESDRTLMDAVEGLLNGDAQSVKAESGSGSEGPAHDAALRAAVAEVKECLHLCPRCGAWVCDDCWNARLLMCGKCAPIKAPQPSGS